MQRAARLGAILTAAMVVLVLVTSPLYVDGQFHGNWLLVASLAIGLVGFYCMHTTRGTLSGNARFRPYGEMLATEGVVRLGGALVLLALGVNNAGAYGMCMALSPFVAVAVSLRKREKLLEPGPPAPYSELSNALGWLLAGSVLMQLLGYSSLLGVNLLKGSGDADTLAVAAFTSAFFVARIPPLLFQAVQGTLLPKLASLAGAGRHDDFRTGFKQLLVIVDRHRDRRDRRGVHDRRAGRQDPVPAVHDRQRRPRPARRRQRHVHHRADRRAGPARAEGPRAGRARLAPRRHRVRHRRGAARSPDLEMRVEIGFLAGVDRQHGW